jgi:glutamate-1-semialdehyde aminotransferase
MAKDPVITKSNEIWSRSLGLIPGGTQTLAKGPGQWTEGVAPKYVARGRGARVWDVDGNEYVDLIMAVGPVSLGYCYPAVDEAIKAQLADGITFSLMHPLEVEVAELVREVVPNTESVRFSKTGCDATSAAVRLARAFTKREKVICCGYHGWHDWYISVTDRSAGIPESTKSLVYTFKYNDLQSLEDARAWLPRRRARPVRQVRRTLDLRRDVDGLPRRARRRPAALERARRPRVLLESDRERHADQRAQRAQRRDGPLREGRLLLHDVRR